MCFINKLAISLPLYVLSLAWIHLLQSRQEPRGSLLSWVSLETLPLQNLQDISFACTAFSDFPYLLILAFQRIFERYFIECLSIQICLIISSQLEYGYGVMGLYYSGFSRDPKREEIIYTEWGISRFTIVHIENNTIINNNTWINCVLPTLNYEPTFVWPYK